MFRGSYDERYGLSNGYMTRLHAGANITEVEKLEAMFPERRLEEYLRKNAGNQVEQATGD
jgi:hypothetical protein